MSQSGPDRALGKLAEGLYQRKLLIKRDSESLFLSFGERVSRSIVSADVARALDAPGARERRLRAAGRETISGDLS